MLRVLKTVERSLKLSAFVDTVITKLLLCSQQVTNLSLIMLIRKDQIKGIFSVVFYILISLHYIVNLATSALGTKAQISLGGIGKGLTIIENNLFVSDQWASLFSKEGQYFIFMLLVVLENLITK